MLNFFSVVYTVFMLLSNCRAYITVDSDRLIATHCKTTLSLYVFMIVKQQYLIIDVATLYDEFIREVPGNQQDDIEQDNDTD